jgi:hypothetical protein
MSAPDPSLFAIVRIGTFSAKRVLTGASGFRRDTAATVERMP